MRAVWIVKVEQHFPTYEIDGLDSSYFQAQIMLNNNVHSYCQSANLVI